MKNTYLITGFPGFISTEMIKALIEKKIAKQIYVLVLPGMLEKARTSINEINDYHQLDPTTISMIVGDITKDDLGISLQVKNELSASVTHVLHLAAIYDLAVPREIAYKVNVEGTKNVNSLILSLPSLKRYIYFSTAYVAGNRTGTLYENELVMPQSFKNHYEQTKYEAEKLVREIAETIPTTIIRPGIVKGHSKTGETNKFDGPYFMLNFLERLKFSPVIPFIGKGNVKVQLVPIDYIIAATIFLGHNEIGVNKTYHLTDPSPYTVREVYKWITEAHLHKIPRGTVPVSFVKLLLSFQLIRKLFHIEKEALDYFTWDAQFDSTNAQKDLEKANITCPDLKQTIKPMVTYYLENKHNRSKHVSIR
ncbi:SDR family oxidoreductase [Bacillus timonensis]|nr:SDR family oxidoreductase [Bacillus timonensis]